MEQRVILPKEDEVRREVRVKRFLIFLLGLDAKRPWELVVRPFVRSRSLQQNSFLWALYEEILRKGGEELGGWTKDDLHDFFLIEHFGGEPKTLFGRKRIKPLKRSSHLNKQEFSDFIATIQRFMAERGVYLDDPEQFRARAA